MVPLPWEALLTRKMNCIIKICTMWRSGVRNSNRYFNWNGSQYSFFSDRTPCNDDQVSTKESQITSNTEVSITKSPEVPVERNSTSYWKAVFIICVISFILVLLCIGYSGYRRRYRRNRRPQGKLHTDDAVFTYRADDYEMSTIP